MFRLIPFRVLLRVLRLQAGHKYCLLGRLSSEVGWNHYDTIKVKVHSPSFWSFAYYFFQLGVLMKRLFCNFSVFPFINSWYFSSLDCYLLWFQVLLLYYDELDVVKIHYWILKELVPSVDCVTYRYILSAYLNELINVLSFVCLGAWEKEKGQSPGNLWKEETIEQIESQGWGYCCWEARITARRHCSYQVLKYIIIDSCWVISLWKNVACPVSFRLSIKICFGCYLSLAEYSDSWILLNTAS